MTFRDLTSRLIAAVLLVAFTAQTAIAQPPAPDDGFDDDLGGTSAPGAAPSPAPAAAPAPAPAAAPAPGTATQAGPRRVSEAESFFSITRTGPAVIPGSVTPENPFGDPPPPPVFDVRPPPSAERVEGLTQMEREVERLTEASSVYRSVVTSLLGREYQRQRRVRTRWFTQRIGVEREALVRSRDEAIAVFERFIERYPFDSTYTADAMFRLGELYFDRSQQRADDAVAARRTGDAAPSDAEDLDYSDTIRTYRTLVTRFPTYERLDTALYLIGYCSFFSATDPDGQREARAAWLGITCANDFQYVPDAFDAGPSSRDPLDLAVRNEGARIAAEANAPVAITVAPASSTGHAQRPPMASPFAACVGREAQREDGTMGPSRHLDQAWLLIGDSYFLEEGTLNGRIGAWLAIDAYARVLLDEDSPNFEAALYKTAWAYFKVQGYVEAVRTFARLLDRVDAARATGGRVSAGGRLRPEALRFLAMSIVYVDWDQLANAPEGPNPYALQRLREYVPESSPWAAEAYFETGGILFEEQRTIDAVSVWRYALERWPTNRRAPEITEQVRVALHDVRDEAGEAAMIDALGQFGEGSAWWNANQDHPAEQIRAADLARNALLDSAFSHHEAAQARQATCTGDAQTDAACQAAARVEYLAAAEAYRVYLERYPNDPRAYELHYSLADTMFWSGDYARAAAEYEWVRDSNLDNAHLSEAGQGVVEAYHRMLTLATHEGRILPRQTAPVPDQYHRVNPQEIPELILNLARARQTYNARVDELRDRQGRRAIYDYDNALVLFYYGYWDLARQRLTRIFEERCAGPEANEWGREAWTALRAIAIARDDSEAVANLARALNDRQCTFSPDGVAVQASREFCARTENAELPQCQGLRDLTSLLYQEALRVFARAQNTTGPEQRELYEQAATMLVGAVDEHPEDPQAPQALEMAAQALNATARFESAGRLYERIIREVGARTAADDAERSQNDVIVANAHFQLAENAKQYFDFERALAFYRQLADGERFAQAADPRVQTFRRDAVTNAALLLRRLRRFPEASVYFRRLIELTTDAEIRRDAEFQIADMAHQARDYAGAARLFREFINRYGADANSAARIVEAYWIVAESIRQQRRPANEYREALSDVVDAFRRSGLAPASPAAYFAAKAAYAIADEGTMRAQTVTVSFGRPANAQALLAAVTQAIGQARANVTDPYVQAMSEVEAYRVSEFFIASRVASARASERLLEATREGLRNVDYRAMVVETFRQRTLAELQNRGITGATARRTLDSMVQRLEDEGTFDEAAFEAQNAIESSLDASISGLSCEVVVRYVTATRVALAAHIDNASTQYALNRLQAYAQEQIGQCIAAQRAQDASFQPYSPGEFQRASQRQSLDAAPDYPVPMLTTEAR